MKTMRSALFAASLALIAQATLTPATDVSKLGPQTGSTVPAFSAADQHGRMQTLSSIQGPKGAMLVFSRSADW